MSKVRGQPRSARHGAAIVLSALVVPQGTLLLLRTEPSLDLALHSASVHLVVVSAISACALAVAVAAAVAAGRSRDGSLVLLALGCLAVGFLMLGHGLTTPGVRGRPPNLWVARLPVLAIDAFAACLGPAALRSLAEGAYLHDVGKVGIPDHVLNKPGPLTDASTAPATPTASPGSRSRWPPASSPWSTCGTHSPPTVPTARPGHPTGPCATWKRGAAPTSTHCLDASSP